MPRAKSAADKLVIGGGTAPPKPIAQSLVSDFIKNMLLHPDVKEAKSIIREHAGREFNKDRDGDKLESLRLAQVRIKKDIDDIDTELKELQIARSKTSREIPSNNIGKKIRLLNWDKADLLSSGLLLTALITVMIMGWSNTYANMMASGEPVFLEQPLLAMCIAALVPCASMVFKFISQFFSYGKSKKHYAQSIYGVTLLVILAWTVLFALKFQGAASGLDPDAILEGDGGKGAILTWLQLVCEILVAGALFLALEDISLKYDPQSKDKNSDYIDLDKSIRILKAEQAELAKTHSENHKEIIRLESTCEIFILERLAEFNALRSRFNTINQL